MLSDRFGTRAIATIGLVVVLGSYLAAATLDENTTTWGYILRLAPLGLGMGIFQQTVGTAVLGAFWAGRTFFHAGAVLPEGATAAPKFAQVAGLQETFWVVAGLMVLTILFSFSKRLFRSAPASVELVTEPAGDRPD